MGYARLLHPERSPDQAPTNRCEILQNPARQRETAPQAILDFSRSVERAYSGPASRLAMSGQFTQQIVRGPKIVGLVAFAEATIDS